MERIFAPWRMSYLRKGLKEGECVLCAALAGAGSQGSLVVHEGERAFVVMNLYPYSSGHLMVAPRRHLARLAEAAPEELAEMMTLSQRLEQLLQEAYHPDGLNLGMNLGHAAGAGVADHIHLHLVPRWAGDTNFMTVTAGTRVVPEDPVEAAARLRESFMR